MFSLGEKKGKKNSSAIIELSFIPDACVYLVKLFFVITGTAGSINNNGSAYLSFIRGFLLKIIISSEASTNYTNVGTQI